MAKQSSTWNITDGSYKGVTFHVAVPVASSLFGITDQEVTKERRLQVSEKPLVDGADVEDFGAKPQSYSATIVFFGGDYYKDLKALETVLNDGKTGLLILPDIDEAVYAKVQKTSRKTSQDGDVTTLSVNWVQDNAGSTTAISRFANAANSLSVNNLPASLPTTQDQIGDVLGKAQTALKVLNRNTLVNALQAAQNAVINTITSINNIINIPRNARQDLLNIIQTARTDLQAIQAIAAGLASLTDSLDLGSQSSATRYNTGIGAVDFILPDTTATTIVAGAATVTVTPPPTQNIPSLAHGADLLVEKLPEIKASRVKLETGTLGGTSDFSTASVALENSIIDLISIVQTKTSKSVVTVINTSLLEVCFQNGLTIADIDTVYKKNPSINDILDIPPLTVIQL